MSRSFPKEEGNPRVVSAAADQQLAVRQQSLGMLRKCHRLQLLTQEKKRMWHFVTKYQNHCIVHYAALSLISR